MDPAVACGEHLGRGEQRLEVLGLLLPAGQLLRIAVGLDDLLVVDRHRDEEEVPLRALEHRVHLPGEQPELGGEELAGARAAALGEELLHHPVVHELLHVGLEGRGVDLVVLERAPQEERAAAPEEGAEGEEGEVRARRHHRHRVAAVPEHGAHHQVVDVALVRGADHQRRAGGRPHRALEAGLVHLDAVVDAVEDPVEQGRAQAHHRRVQPRGDLLEALARLALHALRPAPRLLRHRLQRLAQVAVSQRLLEQAAGGLARRTEDRPRLAREVLVQGPADLPGDERVRQLRVLGHELPQVDGLAHAELCALVVAEEGDHRVREPGHVRAAEDPIQKAGLERLGPLVPDEQLGHEEHRPLALARHRHQGGEGVLAALLSLRQAQRAPAQEDQPRAALPSRPGEAHVEVAALRGPAPRTGDPPAQVHHRPHRRQVAPEHRPREVEVVHPRGAAHHVDHEAFRVERTELLLGFGREADVVEVARAEAAGERAELVRDRRHLPDDGSGAGAAGVRGAVLVLPGGDERFRHSPYMFSGVATPSNESAEARVIRTASVSARRAERSASLPSTSTRFSFSWLPSVYQRLKAAERSSR